MNNDTNSFPIEPKLSTFFDEERAETHAPVDLFDRIEERLMEQDSKRGWTRVFSFASGHGQMLGIGIAAALVIMVGASLVTFSGNGFLILGDSGTAGNPGGQVTVGAGSPLSSETQAAVPRAAAGETVVQTVTVQRVLADQVLQTVVVLESGGNSGAPIAAATVTPSPWLALSAAETIGRSQHSSGWLRHHARAVLRTVEAGSCWRACCSAGIAFRHVL
jgi:hypothetical protein